MKLRFYFKKSSSFCISSGEKGQRLHSLSSDNSNKVIRQSPTLNKIMHEITTHSSSLLPPPPTSLLDSPEEKNTQEFERPFTTEDLNFNHNNNNFTVHHTPQNSTSTVLRNSSYNDALNTFDDNRFDTIKTRKEIKSPSHKPQFQTAQPTSFKDLMPPGYLFSAQIMKPYITKGVGGEGPQEMTIGEIVHVVARNSAGMEAENGEVFGVRNSQWSSDVPLDFRTQLLTLPAWCIKPLDEFI